MNAVQTLGWIIWGFGCLFLLNALLGLRKKKRRVRRIVSCVLIGTGLAVTYFTPFSKFHLLWILPLQLLLGLLLFGLWAVFALSYAKIRQRRPEKKTLADGEFAPFGALSWSGDNWNGKIRFPAWAGFQSRGGPYGSQDSDSASDGSAAVTVTPGEEPATLTPSVMQCRAVQFQLENGQKVVDSVMAALLPYYRKLKQGADSSDEEMPPVSSAEDFRNLIGLSQVHVLSSHADGMAHIGLEFGCNWDEEHGLGVVLHGARVVDIGQADISFCWQPEESETNQLASLTS